MADRAPAPVRKTGMLNVHPDRPVLETGMALDALDRYYWYMAELVGFCRAAGLDSTGQKHEVIERVRAHLQGRLDPVVRRTPGTPLSSAKAAKAEVVGARKFHPDEPIGRNYTCDAETRAYFESVIGPHFHFTAHLQRFRRTHVGEPLTYGDLAREWVAEFERRKDKNYTPAIMHTWEYNTFVRDYMRDKSRNAGKTIKDAAQAWNDVRQSCGPRDYASSIARASAGPKTT